jgi:RNA polymerase-binding protein DksA
MIMNARELHALAEALRRQRAVLVGEVADAEADLQFIAEDREPELEEYAQEERSARVLAQLDERGKHEIEEIDAALRRITAGTYGTCEECGNPIALARLRAVPATRFCVDCAQDQEKTPLPAPEEIVHHPGHIPPDLRLFSDRELEEYVRERVRDDGQVDMEELRLVCRHGVVHLEGALPSEAEHSILLQTLTDVIGLEEIIDRLQIKEVLWEREEWGKAIPAEEPLLAKEPDSTEDIVESVEEGIEYVPPIGPIPEEE